MDSDRLLRLLTHVGVAALLAVGVMRAGIYLGYALPEISAPDQPFHLEGASVHFAWCVEHGLPLYPEGRGPAYAVNFMGPCYFWLVGAIGRLFDADIPTLYFIGRLVTFICGLGPAIIAALYLHRRYGVWAAFVGFAFGLGSAPMVAYGVMARPDMMADLFGAAGFFAACALGRRWLPIAAVLLAVSCLTKQTSGVWLLAAVVVLLLDNQTRRRAFVLAAAAATTVLIIVSGLAATGERHIVSSLFGQGGMSFDAEQSLGILLMLVYRSPEMLLFVLIGCVLWATEPYKDRMLLILTAVWLLAAVLSCAKRGSDLNYFLPLRIIEAIAAGTFCIAAVQSTRHRIAWAITAWAAMLAMAPSTNFALETAANAVERRTSEDGRARWQQLEPWRKLAQDSNARLLTDSDRLAVYQGSRAAFFDAYLFRLSVDAGRIDPRELVDRLNARWFSYVVLSADASGEYHDRFFYRLPSQVAAAVRANYRLQSKDDGVFVYVPRDPTE